MSEQSASTARTDNRSAGWRVMDLRMAADLQASRHPVPGAGYGLTPAGGHGGADHRRPGPGPVGALGSPDLGGPGWYRWAAIAGSVPGLAIAVAAIARAVWS